MFRKSFISSTLCIILMLTMLSPASALSDESITAPSAILMESSTGKILFEKNAHEQRPCASVTKVMTLLLVFEAIESGKLSYDTTITTSAHASSMGGSDIWLEEGETMSADDMIKATVVASANDASVALAEHISGSEDAFIEMMNNRAKELGMKDTVFKNCNGLDEEGHVTSAYDVAVMTRELTKHEKVFEYTSIWIDTLRGGETQIVNTNKLLKTYNGITGLKTGTTDAAGCCMSATATRGNVSLVAVVLGCDTGKQRFSDSAALLDYGFANISIKELTIPEDMPKTLKVNNGMKNELSIKSEVSSNVVIEKGSNAKIKTQVNLPESIDAPITQNQKVGTLKYSIDGKEVYTCDITATEEIAESTFGQVFAMLFNSLISL